MPRHPITPEQYKRQIELLEEMGGDVPLPVLYMRVNKWRRKIGLPAITKTHIRRLMVQHGIDWEIDETSSWITAPIAGRLMWRAETTFQDWVDLGFGFPLIRRGAYAHQYVRKRDLKQWAMQHQRVFYGLPEDNLYLLGLPEHWSQYKFLPRPFAKRYRQGIDTELCAVYTG